MAFSADRPRATTPVTFRGCIRRWASTWRPCSAAASSRSASAGAVRRRDTSGRLASGSRAHRRSRRSGGGDRLRAVRTGVRRAHRGRRGDAWARPAAGGSHNVGRVRGHVLRAGVLGGLTLLAHPIAALYAVLASTVLWGTRGAPPRMLAAPLIALAIGGLWFVPMVLRHGVEPLLTGLGSREFDPVENLVTLLAGALNPPNLAFTIGAVGIVVAAYRRRWDLLAWLAVSALGVAVVDRWVVIPLAVLAGLAVDAALTRPSQLRSAALLAVAGVVAITGIVLARPAEMLTSEERAVMAWAASETQSDATFAVIGYPADRGMVDWFPALSQRESVTTWQGSEWVPNGYPAHGSDRGGTLPNPRMPARSRLLRPTSWLLSGHRGRAQVRPPERLRTRGPMTASDLPPVEGKRPTARTRPVAACAHRRPRRRVGFQREGQSMET